MTLSAVGEASSHGVAELVPIQKHRFSASLAGLW
jgi:hypothetical protein